MIQLRKYQQDAIAQTKAALSSHDRICAVMPTGAGKSTVFSRFVQICTRNGKKVLFFVHSKELVEQFADRLMKQFEIPSGIIMSGVAPKPQRPVQVASVQTLVRRERPDADVVIIDECHRSKAKSYEKILEWYPKAKVIGLTATPFRTDGKPLGEIYETIVHPVKIRELMEMGFLVSTKVYVPAANVDLSGIRTRAGDYASGELAERYSDSAVVQGVVSNYLKFAKGKKMIVFNVNVEHSKLANERFLEAGIPSAHLDGTTPKNVRDALVRDFRTGKIKVLHNVALFIEGFDVPDTDGVILNRATKSEMFYVQMVGRGLRPAKGKTECIVLDHGGNTERFGFVEDYDQRAFDLNEKRGSERKGEGGPKKCEECNEGIAEFVHESEQFRHYECSCCGAESQRAVRKTVFVEEMEFKLLERDALLVQSISNKKYSAVKNGKLPLSQLRIYAKIKGYKNGWAFHTAIDSGLVDLKKDDPQAFKKFNFLLQMEERKAKTNTILEELKSQS